MSKCRKRETLPSVIALIGALGLASSAVAQSNSGITTEGRASLSNGLRAGMSAEEVAILVDNLPDVRSAKASGSKKNPEIKVKYVNDFSNLNGFDFTFSFNFQDRKLFWVDLVSRPICDNSIDLIKSDLVTNLSSAYGAADASGTFHKNNTDVYVIQKAQPRSSYRGDPAIELDIARIEAGVILNCDGGWLQRLTVRFKEKFVYSSVPLDAVTSARLEAEAQIARENAAAKKKSDAERLSLPE